MIYLLWLFGLSRQEKENLVYHFRGIRHLLLEGLFCLMLLQLFQVLFLLTQQKALIQQKGCDLSFHKSC